MIQQGWREQYDRMRRSHARFVAIASGHISAGSDQARDALFHFFQDAHHLKDWLINDDAITVARYEIEDAVTASPELSVCADLCNGTKHGKLRAGNRGPRSGDPATAFVRQSVNVRVGTWRKVATIGAVGGELMPGSTVSVDAASVWGAAGFTTHSWVAASKEERWMADELAEKVLMAWDAWLGEHGLLVRPDDA